MFDPLFLPLILFGLYISYKKNIKFFSFNLFLILFWIYYYFNQTIIIIDLPRLIMFNCWTFLILIAYALNDVYKKYEIDKLSKDKYIYLSVFILLFLILPQYTRYIIKDYKVTGKGQSIINIFYRDGDIKVFKKYKDKVYIADPWKSLIISSVTGNYPLHTKSSYMGNDIMFFIGFMNASCKEKTERAMKYNIDLVYSPMFKCEDFKLIESGSDNNYLFEFKR